MNHGTYKVPILHGADQIVIDLVSVGESPDRNPGRFIASPAPHVLAIL